MKKQIGKSLIVVSVIVILVIAFLILRNMKSDNKESLAYKSISQEEAMKIMEKETGYLIVDVRTPEEYSSGHILNAINIPNETIGDGEISLLPDKEQKILVYCRSGNRSKDASSKLAKLGYSNILEFGGISTWSGKIVK